MAKAKKPKPGLRGLPRTGDGYTGGKKPRKEDLLVLKPNGQVPYRGQPPGWKGKLLKLFKD